MSQLLKSIAVSGRGLGHTVHYVAIPFRLFGIIFFSLFLVTLYKGYLTLKGKTATIWRPAKNIILFPLSTRYVVHGVLIGATLFVATNSLKAREIRASDFAEPRLLSALLQGGDGDGEMVETADSLFAKSGRHDSGIGGVSPFDATTEFLDQPEVATSQESSALLKPQLTSTEASDRPRDDVLYYTVQEGDTLSQIATAFRVSINTILWENDLADNDYIQPGQKLTILPTTGVSHRIVSGDTVASLAQKYKADASEILAFNKLTNADQITVDQVLIIPNGSVAAPVAPTPTTRLARLEEQTTGSGYSNTPPPGAQNTGGSGLLWPAISHKINQYLSARHTGVDIDGNTGQPVYAAADGRVELSGWGRGYGLHVIINHGNGMQTLYGHGSKVYVRSGEYVKRGQTIMAIGCTGYCTGPHVHFEVRAGGFRNPLSYLGR